MRLIKISAPRGKGRDLAQLAFHCGITEVSLSEALQHTPDAQPKQRDVLNAELSTPQAKAYIDALLGAPDFNRNDYAVEVREARALLKRTSTRAITHPVPATILDIDEELWQFTHVTSSFVVRVLIAALLAGYGMVHDNLLLMIGGLVFMPFMPIVLALGFGALTGQWRLAAHALGALIAATLLITFGGMIVGSLADPPIMFDAFVSPVVGVSFSLAVGIAGALGTADDSGHRQLVGLAAASQVAILPAWLGISLVFGFSDDVFEKLASFGGNLAGLVIGAVATYAVLAFRGDFSYKLARRMEYEL
jgi:hypothetical protein